MTTGGRGGASGCPDENQLALLAEGAIALADRDVLERHLDRCAACTRLVEELAHLSAPSRPAPTRYRIVRQLGAGAMGVVWEAEDLQLARRVALKFIRPEAAGDRDRRARLLREARTLAQLRHPNVVAVHDVGTTDVAMGDEMFLALELVVGTTAGAWRDAGTRTEDEVLGIWRQAATGLAAIHRAGIVHRDIKPDNVFVADDGRVLIGDFGLAVGEVGELSVSLTVSGTVVGTPLYMAPEQLHGDPASARSDQFGLCVCAWEALAGVRPYVGKTVGALAVAMLTPPTPPARGDRQVWNVLLRGLDPDPAKRWADVDRLLEALDRPRKRRSGIATPLRVGLLAAAAAVALWLGARIGFGDRGGSKPAPDAAPERAARSPAPPDSDVAPPTTLITTAVTSSPVAPPVAPPSRSQPRAQPVGPIPSLPPPPPVQPPPQSPWYTALNRATDLLVHGDAEGCLRVLSTIPPVPATSLDDAMTLRAICLMRAGDCAGGHKAFEIDALRRGWSPHEAEEVATSYDLVYCPLDAPPAARQPERAMTQLERLISVESASCAPLLAQMKQAAIALPDLDKAAGIMSVCMVRDGDCAGARALHRRRFPPGADPEDVARTDKLAAETFARTFPRCR